MSAAPPTSIVCFECKQVWAPLELVLAYAAGVIETSGTDQAVTIPAAADVPFCPSCLHEF